MKITIKVETDALGTVLFTDDHVYIDDSSFSQQAEDTEREELEKRLDKTIDRIKATYGIDPGALEHKKLGEAILQIVQDWGIAPIEPEELGLRVIQRMANPINPTPAQPLRPRPIKDSPQA